MQAAGFHAAEHALNNEALVGVAHLEYVGVLDIELADLDTSISLTNARLELSQECYITLKNNVPF